MTAEAKGRDLFIVDNSVSGWTALRYLEEWCGIAKAFDIATGYFEISALLALDGKWQPLEKIRILMGAEMTYRTRKALLEAVRSRALEGLDASIEADKDANPFLQGVPAILDALRSRQIDCRVYDRDKFHATCVPLVPLKATAGAFSDPQHIDDNGFEWAAVETKRRLRPGMFVAQVVGKSMEPAIPDGAYCLFAAPVEGTRQGKTVLVQLRDATDPESGERYTVKRYESEKTQAGDSWRHEKITLKPVNPDFKPIVLTGADEGQLQVVAEFVEVLGGES